MRAVCVALIVQLAAAGCGDSSSSHDAATFDGQLAVDGQLPVDAGASDAGAVDAQVFDARPPRRFTGCAPDKGCFVNIFTQASVCRDSLCDATNQCTEGAVCEAFQACYAGKVCAVLNQAGSELTCAKLCIPPQRAMGLTPGELPLIGEPADNGQAPWDCGRVNDEGGQPDDPLDYPRYVCIPLGGDDAVRYWPDLTAANGWPYGSSVGVCIDTQSATWNGSPYEQTPAASWSAPAARWRSLAAQHVQAMLDRGPVAAGGSGHLLAQRGASFVGPSSGENRGTPGEWVSAPGIRAAGGCNPATNVGCASGDKCAVVVLSTLPLLTTTECVSDGGVALGGACVVDGETANGQTGISNCIGGTECNDGVCVRVCDTDGSPSCGPGEVCVKHTGYYAGTSFGWCEPSCEPVGVTVDP